VGAGLHNLKQVGARIPHERLVVITGVSGSGKSSLARDVLRENITRLVSQRKAEKPVELRGCKAVHGWEPIERVLEVDQTPIGKTPRSCPATYVGFWDAIRRLYAETTEARLLQDVGLGYLTLGQQSPTLSGGEAQRIKLVTELARSRNDGKDQLPRRASRSPMSLYVLDEPTVGLHMADVEKLIHVLHRLVDAGNSVVVIEHNLDVMAEADWIVDLGPEGGDRGGTIVAQGAPEDIVAARRRTKVVSHTAEILGAFLRERSTAPA
jgi:excinuclease UvrABC ATPase subunit